jgi:site-specific DNA-methyltransferase (adenine-specific)
VYSFVPDLPLDQEWTDVKLYKRYGLTKIEIGFIEAQVAEHDSELFDDSVTEASDDE